MSSGFNPYCFSRPLNIFRQPTHKEIGLFLWRRQRTLKYFINGISVEFGSFVYLLHCPECMANLGAGIFVCLKNIRESGY